MSHSNKTKKMLEEELRTLHSRLADLQELDAQNRQAEGDKSKEKYSTLTQNIAGMIYTGLPDWSTDVILNSKAVCGYPPEDFNLRRIGWLDLVHPDDREEVERQAQRLTCSRESIVQQYRIVDRDGNVRWVEDHKTSRFSSEGVYEGVDGIVFDVTDRKRAEDELRKMRDELETRVKQRTADLAEAVEELKYEIKERHKAEQKLRDSQRQLRQLASELSLAEERLRRRLATDIHDLIGQNLAINKLRLESLRESVSSSEAAQSLDEIIDTMGETIESTRLMTFELSPPVLYELGFEPAVEWLLRKMSQQHELSTNFSTDQMCKPLPINLRVLLFQTVRELLVNVAKHAKARHVTVLVQRIDDRIEVSVEDDGVGFKVSEPTSPKNNKTGGFGLFSIRERVGHIGGRLEVESKPNQGTRVTLQAPLDPSD